MSEEEWEAIEVLKEFRKTGFHTLNLKYNDRVQTTRHIEITIDTILNLIEKQKKELENKDKIIGFMATAIDNYDSQLEICKFKNRGHVIEYFENLVEKENK